MTLLDVPVTLPSQPPDAERRVTLHNICWATYVHLSDGVGPGVRITFDRGRMEIVTLSAEHERIKTMLGRIVEAYADATMVDAEGLGGFTMRREDLDRGLESDECYYVAHASFIIGRPQDFEIDLSVDPPPNLAIEVDISPPDVAKVPIYAALGVHEIWRFDGRAVTFLHRQSDGRYAAVDRSPAFPDLPPEWGSEALAIARAHGQRAAAAEIRRRALEVSRP